MNERTNVMEWTNERTYSLHT